MRLLKNERGSVPPIVVLNLMVIMATVISISLSATMIINTKRVTQRIEDTERKREIRENEVLNYTSENNEIYNMTINNDLEKESFNAQFKVYEDEKLTAQQIRSLQSSIKASNATNTEHFVEYTGPEAVKLQSRYNVRLKYNNDGYVNEVIVTEAE